MSNKNNIENLKKIETYILNNVITLFHNKRKDALENFEPKSLLKELLKKKNPYLLYSLNLNKPQEIIERMLGDRTSSSDETIFGNFLESIAIEVIRLYRNGDKSGAVGIDAEFKDDKNRYFISIKSGSSAFNSSSRKKQIDNFEACKKTYKQNRGDFLEPQAIVGRCYGKYKYTSDKREIQTHWTEYKGERFWEFISGDVNFYTKIIKPLRPQTIDTLSDDYTKSKDKFINLMTKLFTDNFMNGDGGIDWDSIIKFNSSATKVQLK